MAQTRPCRIRSLLSRAFSTPDALARLKANLDRFPGREAIKDFYLLTGKPETPTADATRLLKGLDDRFNSAISAYTPRVPPVSAG